MGEPWHSWIWVDCITPESAERAVGLAAGAGVPVRHGKHGYDSPSHIRIAVRPPEMQDVLQMAWSPMESGLLSPRSQNTTNSAPHSPSSPLGKRARSE